MSLCTATPLDMSHAVIGQTPGDCQKAVCNGAGGVTKVNDAADVPTSTTLCQTSPSCTGQPLKPHFTFAPQGTSCVGDGQPSKQVCGPPNDATFGGTCVQCNGDADCVSINDAGTLTCSSFHVCQ
jgi:hypothetical protein